MSTPHITDELPQLLTGEATHDVVLAAAEHLRTCPDCQQELVSAVVAHASLTSAQRFAPEIVATDSGSGTHRASDLDDELDADFPALPDLSSVFAQARADAEAKVRKPRVLRRAAVALVAAAVVGGGAYAIVDQTGGSSSPSAEHVALAAVRTSDQGHVIAQVSGSKGGVVSIVDGKTIRIDATSLPKLDRDHVYEVWLTNTARTQMQPIGSIDNDNTASLNVSPKLLPQYNAIEVSTQLTDQTGYSGISVLRGTYNA